MMIPLEEAAARVGLTTHQMKITRQRGLPPGSLGVVQNGRIMFDEAELLPPPRASSSSELSMANTKAELVFAARARGIELPKSITKAGILELLG